MPFIVLAFTQLTITIFVAENPDFSSIFNLTKWVKGDLVTTSVITGAYLSYKLGKWVYEKITNSDEPEQEIPLSPFPIEQPVVYHFHPVAFVEQMKKINNRCYCYEKGLVDKPCSGHGSLIEEFHYEKLSSELDVEKAVFQAIAIIESGGRNSFNVVGGDNYAKILFERHYMYSICKNDFGMTTGELNQYKNQSPDIFNDLSVLKDDGASYGTELEQYPKLTRAKEINYSAAVQSCSWGKFQVMGKYFNKGYESIEDFEKAMNQCELQQYYYFKIYLEKIGGTSMIKAMRDKDWNKIARLYNGPNYTANNYHTKMESEYNKLKSE